MKTFYIVVLNLHKVIKTDSTLKPRIKSNPTLNMIEEIIEAISSENVIFNDFTSKIVVRHFSKNETIKKYDTKEKYVNVIEYGSAGTFAKKGDTDICINIAYETELFCDYASLVSDKETRIKTTALEDCELHSIPYEELKKLYQYIPACQRIPMIMAEMLYLKKQEEQIGLLSLTPEERYRNLLKQRPDILMRTPLKIVASYIGVTPESLSRMRKRVTV